MKKRPYLPLLQCIIMSLASLSLISSTTLPKTSHSLANASSTTQEEELEDFFNIEDLDEDNTLLENEEISMEDSDVKGTLPVEELDDTFQDPEKSATAPTRLQPDLNKVLYDPNMNYGTGAPIPKPEPISTVKRNLIVLGTSTILATVAMLVVASNKGLDAPRQR
jgi:hypothetical protein